MILWQNNTLAEQYIGKMISWETHWPLPKQTHCSKQTILQIGSRNSRKLNGRRTTNPKVFDLHRKNSSKNIMKQKDPQDPQEPELCATTVSLSLIYWCDCAVLFAAPRVVQDWAAFYHHECRDAGTPPCMNMLWSHALPIRVFRVKTVQPSLNLSLFGHENHVSWSFYRLMLRDKRHYLQVLCFEAGSTMIANKHNCPNCCTDTQYQPEKKTYRWHLFDWTFSFYIVYNCIY